MTVVIQKSLRFYYDGYRPVDVAENTELPDSDQCAQHALAHGFGVIKAENKNSGPAPENKRRKK
jgi:hypothetical protein